VFCGTGGTVYSQINTITPGMFVISGGDKSVAVQIDLRAIQSNNGKVVQVKDFDLKSENFVKAIQGSKLIVFSDDTTGKTQILKAKVRTAVLINSKELIELPMVRPGTFLLEGLKNGVYVYM